jgi:transcriptional regulator with XRE-family HTH domain
MKFKNQATAIKELREIRGMTQKDFANAMKLEHAQFVSNAERGVCAIPLEKLRNLKLVEDEKYLIHTAKLADLSEEIKRILK